MSEQKKLKNYLAQWLAYRARLPISIDRSTMYGDGFFCEEDIKIADARIAYIKREIENLNANPT